MIRLLGIWWPALIDLKQKMNQPCAVASLKLADAARRRREAVATAGIAAFSRRAVRGISRILVICGLIVILSGRMFALDPNQALGQLYHSSWNARNGLNGSVKALAQTTNGYLWVGTSDGLFRFDGLNFERYETLPASSVSALMAIPDGGLWIGFDRGGASLLKNGKVTNYTERDGLPVSRVRRFAQDHDGTIWAAIVGGFARFEGRHWRTVRMDWNYPARSARALFVDSQGTLWVANGTGIMFLPKGGNKFHDTSLRADVVLAFAQAPDGTMLFADDTQATVRAFRPATDLRDGGPPPVRIPANAMLFDRDGALWLAGNGLSRIPFLSRMSGGRITEFSLDAERFTEKQGLTGNDAETVLEDREGNIWVGTDGGLDRFRYRNLTLFSFPSGTSLFSLVAGDHGAVWAGSHGNKLQGMTRVQDGRVAQGGPSNAFMTYRDPDGSIWISARNALFRWSDGRFSEIAPPEEAIRMHNSHPKDPIMVSSITKDRSGSLWAAIGGLGEFELSDGLWKFVEALPAHPDWASNFAYTDAGDRIWLAYGEYVAVIDHGRKRAFSSPDGLSVGPFTVIADDGQRTWVGGEGGLAFSQGERFYTLKGAGGGGFGPVNGIVARPNDGLWLSAGPGIVHIPEQEVQHALRQHDYPVNYEVLDLVSDLPEQLQKNGSYSSGAIQGSDGLLWFATRGGVARVDPTHIFRNPLPPPVVIRSLLADGVSYSTFTNTKLPALTKGLQIDYTALSLSIPERVRFRYKLEGSDTAWHDAGVRRQAFYTNPKPGSYRFRVLACNNDGVWNESGATLDFSIAPAFYQTIWFQAIYCVGGAGILWLLYVLRLKQATAQMHVRLEGRLAERERIARELHDTLLQSFQGLMLRLQVVYELLPPGKAKEQLEQSLERGDQAIAEGRRAVHDLRSTPGNDLTQALQGAADELVCEGSPTFRLVVEGAPRDLDSMLRDEVYRIACECLRNAFKHARANRIEAELAYGDRIFRLRIRDDGCGIPPKMQQAGRSGHYGLSGMRERARQTGCKLDIWSSAGSGTEIDLSVPGAIAYSKSPGRPRLQLFRKKVG